MGRRLREFPPKSNFGTLSVVMAAVALLVICGLSFLLIWSSM